jgi:hypothetical protein
MVIQVAGYTYSVRTKATYLAQSGLQKIGRRYFLKYAPSGYFNPDGTRGMVDSEDPNETEFIGTPEDGKWMPKKVFRELTDLEAQSMQERMQCDPEYMAEILDFHLSPVGTAPLLSVLLEDYTPTAEESEAMKKAEYFFYENGMASSPKKDGSSTPIPDESQKEKEKPTTPINS